MLLAEHHEITTSILKYYYFYVRHTGNICQKYRKEKGFTTKNINASVNLQLSKYTMYSVHMYVINNVQH